MTDVQQDAPGARPLDGPSRVAIVTLGCGRNEVDSDQLAGLFDQQGIVVVDEPDDADVVLVNTCTFIAPAKQESIDTVLAACDLKDPEQGGGVRGVVVVGCMAQRYPQDLADSIPEADTVVGFAGYPSLPGVVADLMAGRTGARMIGFDDEPAPEAAPRRDLPLVSISSTTPEPAATGAPWLAAVPEQARDDAPASPPGTAQDDLDRIPASGPRFPVRARLDDRPWAYLKIASGCDRLCTFCAIPSFRGRFRSRPLDELLAEASWLSSQGVRELVLVSENTTSWGKDLDAWAGTPGGRSLQATMLRELAAVDGIERLRLMYLQPAELQPALIEAMADIDVVVPYFDLSLQHVSDPVLTRMARSGSPERFGALMGRIRDLAPDAVFRSNFILGFPGETDHDVDVLEDFLSEQRLDWVGLFTFSREDGTPSDHLDDQVPEALARERLERIASVQERVADEATRAFVGRRLDVLVEERHEGELLGRSYREAPDTDGEVRLVTPQGRVPDLPIGRMVSATVVDADGVDLVAEVDGQ